MPRLRNKLVDNAIKLLMNEHVIVPVKDNIDTVVDKQVMNWLLPLSPIDGKFIITGNTFATPFPVWCGLSATSLISVSSTNKMMDKNKP
jgi:hypothetical protein